MPFPWRSQTIDASSQGINHHVDRRPGVAASGSNGLEENMLEMEQSVEVRDANIAAFWDVFCRDGSLEAEISKSLAIAGVSESVFYEQSQSKEDIVSAFLNDRHAFWMRWFENEIEARYEATGGGLEIIADVLQIGFEDPKCFGCAFINIVTEGGDLDNEPFAIARDQKDHLRRFIEQLAVKMGLQHPNMAASAAVLVIEQTILRTLKSGSLKEAQTARLLFQCLQHA
jgi:AcrR family transcriptional regulator